MFASHPRMREGDFRHIFLQQAGVYSTFQICVFQLNYASDWSRYYELLRAVVTLEASQSRA